jgi:hypothetical protein
MESNSAAEQQGLVEKISSNLQEFWSSLSNKQKTILKKIWLVVTYKWKWQIIFNAPFLVIWILDQTIPSVHYFDMQLLSSLPIPMSIKVLLGFG